jgi:hypothetical protein
MQKKSPLKSASVSPRALVVLFVSAAACLIVTRTLPAFLPSEAPAKLSQRTLTFAERVAYQRAIEDVYWRHRIWPKERPDAKPSLDAVMSQAQLERKSPITSANHRRLKITGNGRLQPRSYKLKWIAWQSTPSSQRCCANSSRRLGTILLSSLSVWPGQFW